MLNKQLAGSCGVYCGCCTYYRAYHDANEKLQQELAQQLNCSVERIRCFGCLSPTGCSVEELYFGPQGCYVKKCTQEKGITYCSECTTFPCDELEKMNQEFAAITGPDMNIIENLKSLQSLGLKAYLEEQERRWTCPFCTTKLNWQDYQCPRCGVKVRDKE